ncbi:MAG: thioredoxin domain-containing protein [Desulfuromonadaceae bacterium]|nr:thioredoxin domain-containing protein [Desulfuromonadaceae bacterium]
MTKSENTDFFVADINSAENNSPTARSCSCFNNLIYSKSPYLRQHSENPVDWYEWGAAPFERAAAENLPIFLSIGYATCHWCHVMAHESFEDEEVAALLNKNFVCIKVDREERPDIDDFYMTVSQTLTGSGGWPLNIFMKPDRRPFLAVTYLPRLGYGGVGGLMDLLANIALLWQEQPERIEKNCQGIMDALKKIELTPCMPVSPDLMQVDKKAFNSLKQIYDSANGGFGRRPKFPMPIYLNWLIKRAKYLPDILDAPSALSVETALQMALNTLQKIRAGGIWDQLGGGIHRYSVDQFWLVPHFEKMLYDQAMLARITTNAFLATGNKFYRTMTDELILFVMRELQCDEGAFCSALDADSEGGEGHFYLWDKNEIDICLGTYSEHFCKGYSVTENGNYEGKNILSLALKDEYFSDSSHSYDNTFNIPERCRADLLKLREKRVRPVRDDKIITSWNGLMISAMAKAGIVNNVSEYIATAERAALFIVNNLRRADGRLLRCYLDGAFDVPAFLEDYAFLAGGLIDLFEATLEEFWLDTARVLAEDMISLFRDPESGRFTLTGHDAEQMPSDVMTDRDGVTPSALGRAAHTLYRLGRVDDRPELLAYSTEILNGILPEINRNPLGHLEALQLLSTLDAEPVIARFSGKKDSEAVSPLNHALHNYPIRELIVQVENGDYPVSVSLCMGGVCYPSVFNADELVRLLKCDLPAACSM